MEELTPRVRKARWAAVIAVVGFGLYWWWPGITGSENPATHPEIVAVGNGQFARSEEKVLRRLREEGYSATWADPVDTWCDVANVLAAEVPRPTRAIVVHVETTSTECEASAADDVRAVARDLNVRLVVVVGLSEGDRDDPVTVDLIDAGATVVDPVELLGSPTDIDVRAACLWWDDCVFDGTGYVVLRDADGLTAAGQQRVARMIVAAVQT